MSTIKRLEGRIAFVTGASRGMGAAIAKRYAQEGAHVILTAKSQAALEEVDDEIRAGGGQATLLPMDLTDFDKIDLTGAAIFERFGKLDILVGNAGFLGDMTPISHLEPRIWDKVIGTNLTANYRLLRSMDPLLKLSEAGRAIFLSSGTTKGPRAYWSAYAVSKMALEHMVQIYAAENAKTKIRANLIDPGKTRTRMRELAYPGEDPMTLKMPEEKTDAFVEMAEASYDKQGVVVRLEK